ncbi:hypothetical protein [Thiorhodococcus fuscus]|uniref:Helix-turn-helix domain-containing protein n=1 Tax=Thiorhodococcus fuscus TaxID=527200 RepID=A0ABW4YAD2_9GAMM
MKAQKDITRDLVRSLGGPVKVAALIREATSKPITSQAVSQWKAIPNGYRKILADGSGGLHTVESLSPDIFGPILIGQTGKRAA